MIMRSTFLVLGLLAVLTGGVLTMVISGPFALHSTPPEPKPLHHEVLVAARPIETGALLRLDDMAWQPLSPGAAFQGAIQRDTTDMHAFLGAVARRDFSAGEPLFASSLVKPGDRGFLAAVLAPGKRAVSVPVDAPQSAAGMMLPGDRVDVILTQNFNEAGTEPGRRSVGETVLRDLRVIAVDQRLSPLAPIVSADQRGVPSDAHLPKTVTLEVTPEQAQALLVATQLGRIELALRSLTDQPGSSLNRLFGRSAPTWAADVSPVLRAAAPQRAPTAIAAPVPAPEPERPKIEVMHGAKTELR